MRLDSGEACKASRLLGGGWRSNLLPMLQALANPRRPGARTMAILLGLLRPLALLLALQLSGLPHAAADLASAVLEVAEGHEVCPEDGSCNDCPAGCPNCHCANGMRLLVPQAWASLLLAPGALAAPAWAAIEDEWHAGPPLAPLDRPPRI
jgi:hypothetical protein